AGQGDTGVSIPGSGRSDRGQGDLTATTEPSVGSGNDDDDDDRPPRTSRTSRPPRPRDLTTIPDG
ncbi:MAG: hypothetical protein LC733_02170, partial [Actinobacteria bacterium]|nr:hypothetical protein [Actinomycetota bacterium]